MDFYAKLRPETDIERCECDTVSGLLLVYMLTSNPIHCSDCRNEIDPERLALTAKEVDQIVECFNAYECLYRLWLDSGEYETYAKDRLKDPKGQVNQSGMKAARLLSERLPTHYWWFYDTDDGVPAHCPSCNALLDENVKWGTGKCDKCHVFL